MNPIKITTPLTPHILSSLKAGDVVHINGTIYTGRDAAHKRLIALLDSVESLPVELSGQIIYFVGPTPARPGSVIGSAGPTTSSRMDIYSPRLIAEAGLSGMIGKGPRSAAVIVSMKRFKCLYFAATGGAAALIARAIVKAEVVCYEDFGPEAIYKLEVVDFPVIVAIDCEGNNLYESGPEKFRTK